MIFMIKSNGQFEGVRVVMFFNEIIKYINSFIILKIQTFFNTIPF